jgi:hypothetical protein
MFPLPEGEGARAVADRTDTFMLTLTRRLSEKASVE